MTVLMVYPEPLTAKNGMQRILPRDENGFPAENLQALHLFEDGSGTAAADERGGAAGLVEHPVASNNAYSWLSGGGIQLEGTEIVSFQQFDVTEPWMLLSAGSVTGSVGGAATERISMLLGFRDWATGNYRGAALFMRGTTNWNVPTTAPFFQARPSNGAGGLGVAKSLHPSSGLEILDQKIVSTLAYNGADMISATVYAHDGSILASESLTVTDTQITTGTGSVVDTTLQPTIGGTNATYNGGQQQVEVFARYNRVLTSLEIATFISAVAEMGDTRGRPW